MAAFTVNTTPAAGEWKIIDAYSTDVSTSTALLADVALHQYLVKDITITMIDTDGRWIKILNDTTLAIGPVKPKGQIWNVHYESPMVFSGAIYVQTESDKQIHVTMNYRTMPG